MRKRSGVAAAVGALILVPAAVFAQRAGGGAAMAPEHEFGVDVALAYHSVSGGNGVFSITTPVDVRVGFVSATKLSWEGRLGLAFLSTSGTTAYNLSPDVNVLYKLGPGTGPRNMMGPYLTGGLGLGIISFGGGTSGVNFTVNAGVGTRVRAGSGAWRFEGFLAYTPKNTTIGPFGNQFSIGARVGLSLWH